VTGPRWDRSQAGGRTPALLRDWLYRVHKLTARAGVRFLKPALEDMIDRHRLWVPLVIGPRSRIQVDPTASVGGAILNSSSGSISIGPHAFFGQHVIVAAGTHDTALRGEQRFVNLPAEGHDIVIGAGAWVASGAIIIGPCVIGEHAVVGAGAVVTRDVAPHTLVAGVPARFVRHV
jgi:acetyltransferase-like isoleucine patch superfamily enzyme